MPDPDITVLHVDDEEAFTARAREYIQQHYADITIRTARSGDDALAHLEATDSVDCVVSDYEIPGVHGLDLLDTVRDRWPDLPFIFFAEQGGQQVAVPAINAGVTDYFEKRNGTNQFDVMANRIRTAVVKHRAENEFERACEQTDVQFELLVGTVEDSAIFLLDEDGYIQSWNAGAETINGYTSEAIVGEQFSIFYRHDDINAGVPDRNLREAASEGQLKTEGWRVREDGSEFWADVTITALRENDTLVSYAKITRDSTQRRREQLLLEQNDQLRTLIAGISHDLRNPLSVAQGKAELVRDTGDLARLDDVTEALTRATELLDYLERLASEGKQIQEPESVDLNEIAEAAWRVIETNGATLDVKEPVTLMADRQRLQQLLENLFQNAVKHAGSDVAVSVGTTEGQGFYVADDGPGIPEEMRSDIFEMGYTEEVDGTGYGLTICKQIATAHGWHLEATDGTDGGARFEVSDVQIV